jgi:hypothetical protein
LPPIWKSAVLFLEKIKKIVSLQQHIVELDEVQARLEAHPVALGRKHPVYAEITADVAQEFDVFQGQKPVGVVDQQGLPFAEIQVLRELLLDRFGVFVDLFLGEDLAHLRLAAGVADHGRPAAHQGDGLMAVSLHMGQRHDGNKAPDVEARGRRVEADVATHGLAGENAPGLGLVGHLLHEATLTQDVV